MLVQEFDPYDPSWEPTARLERARAVLCLRQSTAKVRSMRSKSQWLEMIARTRPSEFAVTALETQLGREAGSFAPDELEALRAALQALKMRVTPDAPDQTSGARGSLNVDFRREGMGGKGRIYAEIEGRKLRDLMENPVLDEAQVYVFTDAGRLAGFQVDNANTLPDRLEGVLNELESLDLERVACPEAGLEDASLSDVLRWVVQARVIGE